MITSSTSSPRRPVRRTISPITVEARTVAGTSRKTPPKRPTGVRSGSQITASLAPAALIRGDSCIPDRARARPRCAPGRERPGPAGPLRARLDQATDRVERAPHPAVRCVAVSGREEQRQPRAPRPRAAPDPPLPLLGGPLVAALHRPAAPLAAAGRGHLRHEPREVAHVGERRVHVVRRRGYVLRVLMLHC